MARFDLVNVGNYADTAGYDLYWYPGGLWSGIRECGLVLITLFLDPSQLMQIGSIAFSQGTSMNQLVAPLFILMAEALAQGDIAKDIFHGIEQAFAPDQGWAGIEYHVGFHYFRSPVRLQPSHCRCHGPDIDQRNDPKRLSAGFCSRSSKRGGHLGNNDPAQHQPGHFRDYYRELHRQTVYGGCFAGAVIKRLTLSLHYRQGQATAGPDQTDRIRVRRLTNVANVTETQRSNPRLVVDHTTDDFDRYRTRITLHRTDDANRSGRFRGNWSPDFGDIKWKDDVKEVYSDDERYGQDQFHDSVFDHRRDGPQLCRKPLGNRPADNGIDRRLWIEPMGRHDIDLHPLVLPGLSDGSPQHDRLDGPFHLPGSSGSGIRPALAGNCLHFVC